VSVVDLDGDGKAEVALTGDWFIGTTGNYKHFEGIGVYRGKSLILSLAGGAIDDPPAGSCPYILPGTSAFHDPVFGDVDGDGKMEVLLTLKELNLGPSTLFCSLTSRSTRRRLSWTG